VTHQFRQFRFAIDSISPNLGGTLRNGLSRLDVQAVFGADDIQITDNISELFEEINGQVEDSLGVIPSPLAQEKSLLLIDAELSSSLVVNTVATAMLYRSSGRRSFECDGRVADSFWREQWIPFAEVRDERNGRYQRLFADLGPTSAGTFGQIVHEIMVVGVCTEKVIRRVIAESLEQYFRELCIDVKDRHFVQVSSSGMSYTPAYFLRGP
jgi:cell wall assembly regulator SMI1